MVMQLLCSVLLVIMMLSCAINVQLQANDRFCTGYNNIALKVIITQVPAGYYILPV